MSMEENSKSVIFGAGGHAAVLIDTLLACGENAPHAILDTDSSHWGDTLIDVPIRGDETILPRLLNEGVNAFIVGVGSVGSTSLRRRLYELALEMHLSPLSIIHPAAWISPRAKMGVAAQVLAGAIVNVGAVIGENVLINSGAIIEHHCRLGDHVHAASGCRLAGAVRVGKGAHIGAGATIMQGLSVGEDAIVGAGAVVVRDVPPGSVVVGVPAVALRKKAS